MLAGKPVTVAVKPSLADGLAVPVVGSNTLALAKNRVDKMVVVR